MVIPDVLPPDGSAAVVVQLGALYAATPRLDGASLLRRSFAVDVLAQSERCLEVRAREGDGWAIRVAKAGEIIQVHGRQVAVDAIYA